jgi:hypothetical protein
MLLTTVQSGHITVYELMNKHNKEDSLAQRAVKEEELTSDADHSTLCHFSCHQNLNVGFMVFLVLTMTNTTFWRRRGIW